jgi:hypothetical protein
MFKGNSPPFGGELPLNIVFGGACGAAKNYV